MGKQSFSKRLAWNKSIFNDFNNNRYSNQCLPAVKYVGNYSLSHNSVFLFLSCTVFASYYYSTSRLNLSLITVFCAYPSIYTDNQIIYVITRSLLVSCLVS